MPLYVSTDLTSGSKKLVADSNFAGTLINFQPMQTISDKDPAFAAYLKSKWDAPKEDAGDLIRDDVDAFLTGLVGEKVPEDEYKKVIQYFNTYKDLHDTLKNKKAEELTPEVMQKVRADLELLTGENGSGEDFSTVLADFHRATGYAYVGRNEMKAMSHMLSGISRLTTRLESISAQNEFDLANDIYNGARELESSINTYRAEQDAVLAAAEKNGILSEPEKLEGDEKLLRDAETVHLKNLQKMGQEREPLISQISEAADDERRYREQAAFSAKAIKDDENSIASLEKQRSDIEAGFAELDDRIAEAQKQFDDAQARSEEIRSRISRPAKERDDSLAAMGKSAESVLKKTAQDISRCNAWLESVKHGQDKDRGPFIPHDRAELLKTEKGRDILRNSGDEKELINVKIAESYLKIYNDTHPAGFRLWGKSAAEKSLDDIVDKWKGFSERDKMSFGTAFGPFEDEIKRMKTECAGKFGANKDVAKRYLDSYAEAEYAAKRYASTVRNAENEFEKVSQSKVKLEAEKVAKTTEIAKLDNDIKNKLSSKATNESMYKDETAAAEAAKKKSAELKTELEKIDAAMEKELAAKEKCKSAADRIGEFDSSIKDDAEKHTELLGKLARFKALPNVRSSMADTRLTRSQRKLAQFFSRADDDKGLHINSGAYNNMIDVLRKAKDTEADKDLMIDALDKVRKAATDYIRAKGAPAFGNRSAFGMMRLNYAREMSEFAEDMINSLTGKTLPYLSEVKEMQDKLRGIDPEQNLPSVKAKYEAYRKDKLTKNEQSAVKGKDERELGGDENPVVGGNGDQLFVGGH